MEKFDISATPAASKLNVIMYIKSKDEFFIEKRYRKIDGTVETNWESPTGELDKKPKFNSEFKTVNIL